MKSKLIITPLIFILCAGTLAAQEYTESPISTGARTCTYERDFDLINIAPKTFDCEKVEIVEEETRFLVVDASAEEMLFSSQKVSETLYTSTDLNVRINPNMDYRRYNVLAQGTKVKRVGWSQCGWDIIKVGDEFFFVWGEYLTDKKPKEVIEIDSIEEEVIEEPVEEVYYDYEEETSYSSGYTYVGGYELTAYEWTGRPCADGVYPSTGYTAACNDSRLWHKWVYIEGYGTYYVHDVGGMASNVIDIYMGDYDTCIQFGRQYGQVYIIN